MLFFSETNTNNFDFTKLIIFSSILIVVLIFAILFSIIVKKKTAYAKSKTIELDNKSYDYYSNLKLKDDLYFPYFETHASGVRYKFSSQGNKDVLSDVEVKKHFSFYDDNIIYIINNKMKYDLDIVTIDERKYIKLNDKIKTIEILVSFETPSHFLAKFKVNKLDKDKYSIELNVNKEDSEDESRRNENE